MACIRRFEHFLPEPWAPLQEEGALLSQILHFPCTFTHFSSRIPHFFGILKHFSLYLPADFWLWNAEKDTFRFILCHFLTLSNTFCPEFRTF